MRSTHDHRARNRTPFVVVILVLAAIAVAGMGLATPAWATHAWSRMGWQHAQDVVSELEAAPPHAPLVLLLGGSSARESMVSDQSWAAEVGRRAGSPVVAYDLGCSNQTLEQDLALVRGLPKVPAVVFIALNRGRFTAGPTMTTSIAPSADPAGTYTQHHYSVASVQPLPQKLKGVTFWLRARGPLFDQNYAANAVWLDRLVSVCLQRGYHPVLLEMPRNTAVIGHAFDAVLARYQSGARALAARYGIPYLDFVGDMHFADTDFYDLDHLVEPGRTKFQARLAAETAGLLARYRMLPPAVAAAGPTLAPLVSGASALALWPGMAAIVLGSALVMRRRSMRWLRQRP